MERTKDVLNQNDRIVIGGKRWVLEVHPVKDTFDCYTSTDLENYHKLEYIQGLEPTQRHINKCTEELMEVYDTTGEKPTAHVSINEKAQVVGGAEELAVAIKLGLPLHICVRSGFTSYNALKDKEVPAYGSQAYIDAYVKRPDTKESYRYLNQAIGEFQGEFINTILTALNCGAVYEPCNTSGPVFKRGKLVITTADYRYGRELLSYLKEIKAICLKRLYCLQPLTGLTPIKSAKFESEVNWDKAILYLLKSSPSPKEMVSYFKNLELLDFTLMDWRRTSDILKDIIGKLEEANTIDFDIQERFKRYSEAKTTKQKVSFWASIDKDTSSYEEELRLVHKMKVSRTQLRELAKSYEVETKEEARESAFEGAELLHAGKLPMDYIPTATGKLLEKGPKYSEGEARHLEGVPTEQLAIRTTGEVIKR